MKILVVILIALVALDGLATLSYRYAVAERSTQVDRLVQDCGEVLKKVD